LWDDRHFGCTTKFKKKKETLLVAADYFVLHVALRPSLFQFCEIVEVVIIHETI
jgi:hypothetical protein